MRVSKKKYLKTREKRRCLLMNQTLDFVNVEIVNNQTERTVMSIEVPADNPLKSAYDRIAKAFNLNSVTASLNYHVNIQK